jgi:hypothetical protein
LFRPLEILRNNSQLLTIAPLNCCISCQLILPARRQLIFR